MLGHKLVQELRGGHEVFYTVRDTAASVSRSDIFDPRMAIEGFDAEDAGRITRAIESCGPDVVINAVGVVKQSAEAGDAGRVIMINSVLPHRLAASANSRGFRLITVSTDCVFKGTRGGYSESDEPDAVDLYGRSKQLGEPVGDNVLTLRTSIIGRELSTAHGLLEWFLSRRGERVKGFTNAIFSGFPTVVLAAIIRDSILPRPNLSGLYHVAGPAINKFDLLTMIKRRFGLETVIDPADEPRIDRSLNGSRFEADAGYVPESWETMIDRLAEDSKIYGKWRK
jgi:dTDP-4-dehydrorhamnose reductase